MFSCASCITNIYIIQVDCAYYSESLGAIDPTASLKQDLSANHAFDLEQACPQCFENQHKLVSISP